MILRRKKPVVHKLQHQALVEPQQQAFDYFQEEKRNKESSAQQNLIPQNGLECIRGSHQINGEVEGVLNQPSFMESSEKQTEFYATLTNDQSTGNMAGPMFEGSRIDTQSFCSEFLSIAQTFELSERACNDLINLTRRMALPNNDCPVNLYDAQLRISDSNMPPSELATHAKSNLSPKISNSKLSRNNTSNPLKKRRGRPPGSTKAAKYLAMAEAYKWQKQHLEAEKQNPSDSNSKYEAAEQQLDRIKWNEESREEEEFVVLMDDYSHQPTISQTMGKQGSSDVMHQVLGSLNRLSNDLSSLRRQYAQTAKQIPNEEIVQRDEIDNPDRTSDRSIKLRQMRQDFDHRRPKYFVKVFDEFDKIVPICDMTREDMINTVRISRDDPKTRIMYQEQDITERLLQKLDISLYLHNPSYCGRAAADALFNPEFLSHFHILSVGQTASRSHRENLSPELTRVFYDSLRKLGALRIIPEEQFGWMEQARDAVNQRNRDIKVPGCRRKFFQNSDPIFE